MVKDQNGKTERIFFRSTPEFHKKLKRLALEEDKTVTDLIIELVEKRYDEVVKLNSKQ